MKIYTPERDRCPMEEGNDIESYLPEPLDGSYLDHGWREAQELVAMDHRARQRRVDLLVKVGESAIVRALDYLMAKPADRERLYPDVVGALAIKNDPAFREMVEAAIIAKATDSGNVYSCFSIDTRAIATYGGLFFDIRRWSTRKNMMARMLGADLFNPLATPGQAKFGHLIALQLGTPGVKAWLGAPLDQAEEGRLYERIQVLLQRRALLKQWVSVLCCMPVAGHPPCPPASAPTSTGPISTAPTNKDTP